ncbi:MAG: glycosyltransferase family 2 protein [Myxococcaceae bacterium]|jgi:glycosyltransferase involved in cell wall biosynthesis|nr:glycosyltransferase family 2 protein [Myxococcaceae bacterium]
MGQTLSILIPVFNEARTVRRLLERVSQVSFIGDITAQLVVVNDCSTDDTDAEVRAFIAEHPGLDVVYRQHATNQGKGAALHTALEAFTGDFAVVQDADLEYDPGEINALLKPVLDGHADVVYGSRFVGAHPHRVLYFWHTVGNRVLTTLSNAFTNLNLTDMETCYKLWKRDVIKQVAPQLKEKRFGFEPEVTAKVAKLPGVRIYEVGISYFGRSYEEGKKINWKDGVSAVRCIVKYGLGA